MQNIKLQFERSLRVASLLAVMFLVSCSHSPTVTPATEQPSVEQRVASLEQQVNGTNPPPNDSEAQKEYARDLAEIQKMGLVDRAKSDFSSQLPKAAIDSWTIGYFMQTNTVWCDFRYRLAGGSETLQQEFGYSRKPGTTNWTLLWNSTGQPR